MPIREIGAELDAEELEDESIAERLWGLTEMFPEMVRNRTHAVASKTYALGANTLWLSQQVAWYGATTFMFVLFPYVIAKEQVNMIEQQKATQQQLLLGPSAAMAGGGMKK